MLKIIFLSFFFLIHPVHSAHVSLLSFEYSTKSNVFNVFLKMAYKDFILDYRNSINDDQYFDPSGNIDTTIILVSEYFNNKVKIFADDKALKGRLINIGSVDGELKMNFLINNAGNARAYKVKNQILTGLYKDQSNLLIFKYEDLEVGVKLTSDMNERTFNIK